VKDFSKILVFDEEKIAGSGTHMELLRKRGMYYEIYLGQSLDQ